MFNFLCDHQHKYLGVKYCLLLKVILLHVSTNDYLLVVTMSETN
jgi:hypothetical protein